MSGSDNKKPVMVLVDEAPVEEPKALKFPPVASQQAEDLVRPIIGHGGSTIEQQCEVARLYLEEAAQNFVGQLSDEEVRAQLFEVVRFFSFRNVPAIVRNAAVGVVRAARTPQGLPN